MKIALNTILIGIGSLILVATAMLHFTGYAEISAWAERLDSGSFFARAIPGIWLFPFTHWIAIAIAMIAASWLKFSALRPILICMALLVAADATLIFLAVGPFIGSATLLLAALFYAAAAWRMGR